MYIIYIFGVIFVVVYAYYIKEKWEGIGDAIAMFFGLAVAATISALVCVLIVCVVANEVADMEYERVDHYKLYALKDKTAISGSFFLGCGTISEQMKYFYYMEIVKGCFQLDSVSVQRTYIHEYEDEQEPRIEYWNNGFENDTWKRWAWCFLEQKYHIYVPKGTIKHGFVLDL